MGAMQCGSDRNNGGLSYHLRSLGPSTHSQSIYGIDLKHLAAKMQLSSMHIPYTNRSVNTEFHVLEGSKGVYQEEWSHWKPPVLGSVCELHDCWTLPHEPSPTLPTAISLVLTT